MIGLVDDVINLNAKIKLIFQIFAGSVAYFGGMAITVLTFPFIEHLNTGFLSYPLTIFWFLLITNAVNLIDGLDGLAAGVSLLVCLILTLSGCLAGNFVVAAAFACLSGAILGFLRYNFNPATIFMGDSGSYFIGYMIAGLSLFGSIKSHTAVTLFITMLALGIPLTDTVIATIRRYMLGKKIFSADKEHFHHKLLKSGF
ncbi:MAG: undecaprenyl/decaprenyl-phosphate alpha-N-acetylglucosaminyl 1-phosphate transferase, partial [bacterium]|nr:undecaprenyl/decaprenyl-phosphate alpha-N-acetylglucosaminyl 1-phosphate transferase [bacterium]